MKKTKKAPKKAAPKKAANAKPAKKVAAKTAKKPIKKITPKATPKKATKPAAKKPVAVKKKPIAKPVAKPVNKVVKPIVSKGVQKTVKVPAKPVAKVAAKPATPAKAPQKTVAKTIVRKLVLPPKPMPRPDEPKPKGLYSIEYEINSSPEVLFEFISTPGGLEKWFADRVYVIEGNYIFNWEDGEKRLAKQIGIREKDWVRFHWLDEPEKRYFEFRIQIDDLTSEVALIVSDFADNMQEQEESTRLWNQQISDLHHSIGSA
jgi:START-like superfamily domain